MANLRNFFNKVSNNNRIFTAEDIGNMTRNEFGALEEAINFQMNNLGIPRSIDLEGDSDVIFVRAYTRSDGTQVKAHYRSRSGYFGGQTQSSFAQEQDTSKILNDGCFSSNSPVIDEKQGHFDPITGKKVYYDGMQYFGNEGIQYELVPTETLNPQEIDIKQNYSQDPLFETEIQYNDYSPIFKQLLQGNIVELKNKLQEITYQNGLQDKIKLDLGINKLGKIPAPNAAHLWNISSQGIDNNLDYIKQNGKLFDKISDLPKEYQEYAKNKVGTQFGLDNCRGIIFHENSEISRHLEKSDTINDYVKNNFSKLAQGQVIKNDSLSFYKYREFDAFNALGKCDIIEAKMHNGGIEMTLGDTYDFNKNSTNRLVKMGRNAQDAGLLEPYYSIIKIRIKL